jgi:hypothetical protein
VDDSKAGYITNLSWERPGHSISGDLLISGIELEAKLLANMTLDDIHCIFAASSRRYFIQITAPGPGTILLGSLSWSPSEDPHVFNPCSDFSLSDSLGVADGASQGWQLADSSKKLAITSLKGWTR